MKRHITFFVWILFTTVFLLSCAPEGGRHAKGLELKYDNDGNYAGFESMSIEYYAKAALENGWMVVTEDGLQNKEVLLSFFEDSNHGKTCSMRYVQHNLITDVFYDGQIYYCFRMYLATEPEGSNQLLQEKYTYLKYLRGNRPDDEGDTYETPLSGECYVLTLHKDLQFDFTFLIIGTGYVDRVYHEESFVLYKKMFYTKIEE